MKAKHTHHFSTSERRELARKGEALPDGSFPIRNKQDLQNAVQSVGRSKDPRKVKAFIQRRAVQLGAKGELHRLRPHK